jgi:non-specific serine/threonine protein kinase
MVNLDLRQYLESWPYDPEQNVRLVRAADGREIILIRQPGGIEQYEVDGPPDGERPDAEESAFLFRRTVGFQSHPQFEPTEESLFVRQGDFWTIRYQGRIARLKATRGLEWLCNLLRHPGREMHVSKLLMPLIEARELVAKATAQNPSMWESAHTWDACPILDPQAKAEYKRRLEELREDFEEAERFNDRERASKAQEEINSIGAQLASAVGLGGKDRKTGSAAERARSAVTKRIKESIERIGEANPPLGRHLGNYIKTGYFCSYNPPPDHSVAWSF